MTTTREDLRAEAGRTLLRAMFQAKGEFHQALEDIEISHPVAGALLLLDESMPMNELAHRIGCDPSYVTGIADRLEEMGLAERRPLPEDRRVKQLVLTARGKKKADWLAHRAFDSSPFFESLDEADIRALLRILDKAVD